LKILFIVESLTEGGKERRLTELMKALKLYSGIEFSLALMSYDVHYKEVYDLGIDLHFLIRKNKKDITIFHQFYTLCKKYRPDIIHCWDGMTAVYISPVCKILRIKLVNGLVINCPTRRTILYKPWRRARLTFPFSDLIIGNSKAGLKAYNAPPDKSKLIYNGFNFERTADIVPKEVMIRELNINTRYIIGMLATYSQSKDYPTFFRAAAMVVRKRKDVTFLAIGKNTDSEFSKSYIDREAMDHIKLLGSRVGIESIVNILDIGVLATFTEGISNSILEYMALGKPVIATDGGGTSEIVEDNITGFLVHPSDPEELSGKIEILLNDEQLRLTMGQKGFESAMEKFSMSRMTNEFVTVYNDLLLGKN
jgi:glycosyltransferase involved in cell wall biosynthesis